MEKSKLIKKIVLAILAFAIFATTVNALSYTTVEHTINIQISLEGKDTVIERFYIEFTDENERLAFREKSIALGTNIDEWKKFDLAFVPSLGENTTDKKISYNESARNYLEIDYSLAEPLMVKGKDASMLTEYNLKVNYFNGFYQSGL
ncbi:MAG: hypothetical protein NTY48_01840, partial [Candidatus Diapherotrites archaeon]|nr:hypothetical protein [Candidatus Diapherotrites archaeon]